MALAAGQDECSKFGVVERVQVVPLPHEVRIFVLFADAPAAERARAALNSRYFAGRVVAARAYDHRVFLAGNFLA